MAEFLYTYAGMYLAQSLCHSAVAAAIADSSLLAWRITDPRIKQRFRLIVIVSPLLFFPIYQWINPIRGSIYFRLDALFDVNRWFLLEVFGLFSIWSVVLFFITLTALIFVVQELVPIAMHLLELRRSSPEEEEDDGDIPDEVFDRAFDALEGLPMDSIDLQVIDDEELILFSSTGMSPEVFVSTGMLDEMSPDEIKAAVAHELAHIRRSRTPLLMTAYIFRVLMFFNPITLLEFRKVAQEEEKICDDIAVDITGDRESLASALEFMRPDLGAVEQETEDDFTSRASAMELYSLDVQLAARVNRMRVDFDRSEPGGCWVQFALTLAVVVAVNYFIV